MFHVKTSKSGISFEISLVIWDAKESISHLLKCNQCHLCSLLYNIQPTHLTTVNPLDQYALTRLSGDGAQRAKITEKVHKPPRNHYIEWPVFSDIGLNSES